MVRLNKKYQHVDKGTNSLRFWVNLMPKTVKLFSIFN